MHTDNGVLCLVKGSCQDRVRNFIKAISTFSQPAYFGKLFLRAIKTPVSLSGKNSSSSLMADRLYSVLPSCRAGWIPGQARNDVGLGLGGGCFWIPGQARIDVGLGVSALRRAPLPLYRSLYSHFAWRTANAVSMDDRKIHLSALPLL